MCTIGWGKKAKSRGARTFLHVRPWLYTERPKNFPISRLLSRSPVFLVLFLFLRPAWVMTLKPISSSLALLGEGLVGSFSFIR